MSNSMNSNQIRRITEAMDLPFKAKWSFENEPDSCRVTLVNEDNGKRAIKRFDFALQDTKRAVIDLAWKMVERVK